MTTEEKRLEEVRKIARLRSSGIRNRIRKNSQTKNGIQIRF